MMRGGDDADVWLEIRNKWLMDADVGRRGRRNIPKVGYAYIVDLTNTYVAS
jgi:hypothetical protein